MSDRQDPAELEQKIKMSETPLRDAQSRSAVGRIMIVVCLGLIFISSGRPITKIVGCLLLGLNIWRLYKAETDKRKFEREVEGYREQKEKTHSP